MDVNLCLLMGPSRSRGVFYFLFTQGVLEFLIHSIISGKCLKWTDLGLYGLRSLPCEKGEHEKALSSIDSVEYSERVPEDLKRELSMHHFLPCSYVENSAAPAFS